VPLLSIVYSVDAHHVLSSDTSHLVTGRYCLKLPGKPGDQLDCVSTQPNLLIAKSVSSRFSMVGTNPSGQQSKNRYSISRSHIHFAIHDCGSDELVARP
jgi:hypothetical protein